MQPHKRRSITACGPRMRYSLGTRRVNRLDGALSLLFRCGECPHTLPIGLTESDLRM
jgi:hypothetical protein